MARRFVPWLALGVLVVVVLAVAAWPSGHRTPAERAHDLELELKCPECQGLSVADSEAPTSRAIRADIRRRVAAGQGDERIRQAYIDRYGTEILLKPEGSGLGLLVWGLPVVVLALGAAGVAFAVGRGRREPRLRPTPADERLVEGSRQDDERWAP
jgi:cytochrome c-type biogenesis protein CcmH